MKTATLERVLKVHYGRGLREGERVQSGSWPVYGSNGEVGKHIEPLISAPTLVIGRKGSVGSVIYAPKGGWVIDTAFYVELLDPESICLRYLYYAVREAHLENRKITTSIPGISRDDIYRTRIPLPSPEEQKRIAAILDTADGMRRKRTEALNLTDQFLESVFLDMFGDPVTNPKGWEERELSSHLDFMTSGSRGWAQYYASEGNLFLRIQNIGRNELLLDDVAYVNAPDSAEAKRTMVRPGDVLLSITADLGRTGVVPKGLGKAHINQHLALLRPKGINPFYLSAFLASEGGQRQFRSLNRNGVKAGLNFDDVRSLRILVPNEELQTWYADIHDNYSRLRHRLRTTMQTSVDFFGSLVQRAFRGEL